MIQNLVDSLVLTEYYLMFYYEARISRDMLRPCIFLLDPVYVFANDTLPPQMLL